MIMTLQRKRQLVRLIGSLLWCAAAATLVWALFLPVRSVPSTGPNESSPGTKDVRQPAALTTDLPPLQSLNTVANLSLRRPLFDTAVVQNAVKLPPLAFRLTGTIMEPGEPGNNLAILTAKDGSNTLLAVGEKSNGVEILEIAENQVVLLHNGQRITLKVEQQEPAP